MSTEKFLRPPSAAYIPLKIFRPPAAAGVPLKIFGRLRRPVYPSKFFGRLRRPGYPSKFFCRLRRPRTMYDEQVRSCHPNPTRRSPIYVALDSSNVSLQLFVATWNKW
jgi:hypothetical protein